MKIYLDVCCLHRPFDDQTQERIRIESEAVRLVLQMCGTGLHRWTSSEIVECEADQNPNRYTRSAVQTMLRFADDRVVLNESAIRRARYLEQLGIAAMDALHISVAEDHGCDVFLTTDDSLMRRACAMQPPLALKVANPVSWLVERTRDET